MRSLFITAACIGYFHTTLAREPLIAIDDRSCSRNDGGALYYGHYSTYEAIHYSLHTATSWAKQALEQLELNEEDRGHQNREMRRRINEKLDLLIGARDDSSGKHQTFHTFLKHVRGISRYSVDSKRSVADEAWLDDRSIQDVEVFCNADHVFELDPLQLPVGTVVGWWNSHRDDKRQYFSREITKEKELPLRFKKGTTDEPTWIDQWDLPWQNENKGNMPRSRDIPNSIIYNPNWLQKERNFGWRLLTSSRAKNAQAHNWNPLVIIDNAAGRQWALWKASLLEKLGYRQQTLVPFCPAQTLYTMEVVGLNALARTDTGDRCADFPPDQSEGWLQSVKGKRPDNADTVAWFILAVELILNHRHDIDKTGKVVKFDPEAGPVAVRPDGYMPL